MTESIYHTLWLALISHQEKLHSAHRAEGDNEAREQAGRVGHWFQMPKIEAAAVSSGCPVSRSGLSAEQPEPGEMFPGDQIGLYTGR